MLVHAIMLHVAGRFRVFGAKTKVAPVMCLDLSGVRDLKPKHHLCDVFHNLVHVIVSVRVCFRY